MILVKWVLVGIIAIAAFLCFMGALIALADPEGRGGPIGTRFIGIAAVLLSVAVSAAIFWNV